MLGHPQIFMKNITQDEPIDPVNIDDRDLPNYGSPSASDSDDLPNAEELGDNVPLIEASSSDDDFLMPNRSPRPMSMNSFCNHEIPYLDHLPDGPDIFGDTNDEYTSQFGRYIKDHTYDMGTCHDEHFNLDVEMIANVLRVDIEKTPRRKAYIDRKRAFEKVYSTWEGYFAGLPRFMEALKHFNPGTIVEWKTERCVDVIEDVFNYMFWTFKPCIDGFVFCHPVISIDGTHVYGKYDIKLLIAIATDGNDSILHLTFAIVANESMET
ncbi:hypothetical protein KY290_014096 [Solanum tuberosum]|uniref:Uncharacterized protein n=1 Tax=Solanum tuberosum TaxID=4113 RepID=A0ABQ7VQP0_SOLTU|nr:hypothetical protein KY285_013524 [Solanum tuberosum]KAH0770115.1 hypothetical protein KY290_014096 [Solanum tuberosum]